MDTTQKKSGALRICIDPRPLNKALQRQHYPLPVMQDMLSRLANAKVLSELDLSNAYWHVHLDEVSSMLTMFQTPYGHYRWKGLPFWASATSELFQKRLDQALEGLDGVTRVTDDITAWGKGNNLETTSQNHDDNLWALLQKCRESGLEGQGWTAKGPDLLSWASCHGWWSEDWSWEGWGILKMPRPENIEGVPRFCGFVNYLAKFLPKLSDVLVPIRQLTRSDVEWIWTSAYDPPFGTVKRLVTEAPVLAFCDRQKELTIQTDASQTGLGAILLQKPASRCLR